MSCKKIVIDGINGNLSVENDFAARKVNSSQVDQQQLRLNDSSEKYAKVSDPDNILLH